MRRAADVLLIVAVAVVVGAAVVDATAPSASDRVAEAAADLRDADVRGTLVVAAPDCSRKQVELPSLRERPLGVLACSVYGRPGALAVFRGAVVWYAFAGGTTTLLRPEQLDAYVGRPARVLRVAWLGNVRFAAAYRIAGVPGETVALFERANLVRVLSRADAFLDVRSSPNGRFLAVRSRAELALYDVLGERLALPDGVAEEATALAWSPDERWTVAAAADELTVFPTRSAEIAAHIPLGAVDVDWATPPRPAAP